MEVEQQVVDCVMLLLQGGEVEHGGSMVVEQQSLTVLYCCSKWVRWSMEGPWRWSNKI